MVHDGSVKATGDAGPRFLPAYTSPIQPREEFPQPTFLPKLSIRRKISSPALPFRPSPPSEFLPLSWTYLMKFSFSRRFIDVNMHQAFSAAFLIGLMKPWQNWRVFSCESCRLLGQWSDVVKPNLKLVCCWKSSFVSVRNEIARIYSPLTLGRIRCLNSVIIAQISPSSFMTEEGLWHSKSSLTISFRRRSINSRMKKVIYFCPMSNDMEQKPLPNSAILVCRKYEQVFDVTQRCTGKFLNKYDLLFFPTP